MKLRLYLAVLVLAGVIPLVVLTVVVTVSLARQQRAAVERGLADTVSALATALDNDLRTSIRSLETLAATGALDRDDLPAFYAQASRVLALHRWTTIGLVDASGAQRLNLARPLGEPLPDVGDREYFRQVLATGRPYVSDLLRGRATATADIGVAVPVMRGDRVRYVLFAGVDPASFNAVFEAQRLPARAIASIVDRNWVYIARSPDHARYVGRPPPPGYLARIREAAQGTFHGADITGVERDTGHTRMALTGWTVGVGLPAEVFQAPVRRVARTGAIIGFALALSAAALAVVTARRMARSIHTLTARAAALGRGEPLGASERLSVAELDEVRRCLVDADQLLQQRARERDELLEREQTARREAEAASSAKDRFLAMLGHELRNPLGAIASAATVLQVARAPGDAADARAVIDRQVRHLSRLVDDLLDVSRVTSGKVVLVRQPLDLAGVVGNVIRALRAGGRLERHQVSVQAAPAWVDADETRMEQVVSNLVGNAVRYTPAGGDVHVAVGPDGDMVRLEVSDTGSGIPPHLIDRVFDVFVQGERGLDRAPGGLGLGLAVVKSLVSMHGGTVHASSAGDGKGAVFSVRLPRVSAPPAAPEPAAPDGGRRAARRVLIVEDNEDGRQMLRTVLGLAGHDVHEAADGPAGVAQAAAVAPDVALVDIGLPGFDGYEVARRIRSAPGGAAIRLVAITGYGQTEDRQRAIAAGFDAHLTKPIAAERLAEAIAGASARGS